MNSNSGTMKYLSFKGAKDYNGPPKVGFAALASPGQVVTVSTSEGFNSDHNPYSGRILQTNTVCNKQVGTGYTVSTYIPKQFDAHSIGRAHYKRTPPISNTTSQNISVTVGNTFTHRPALNHDSLGGDATTSPGLMAPVNKAFVGTTNLGVSNPSGGSAQLTIFYAGSVCVYNDVSPEKAQAIMLLARNENSSANPPKKTPSSLNTVASRAETQTHKPFGGVSGFHLNKKMSDDHTTSLCLSAIPSPNPISVSIPWNARSGVKGDFGNSPPKITPLYSINFPGPISLSSASSGGFPDPAASRSLASVAAPISKPEPSKPSISQGARVSSKTTTTAVPQFRKASLARFLEKRKERAVTAAPYPNPGRQSPDCATSQSESRSFSITSGSCLSLSSIK